MAVAGWRGRRRRTRLRRDRADRPTRDDDPGRGSRVAAARGDAPPRHRAVLRGVLRRPEGGYIVLAGSAMAVSAAYEVTMGVFPELVQSPRFALMNTAGLAADVLATVAWTSAIATFPNGNLESRWQRWLLRVSWLSLLAVPLLLLGSSTIYTSGWLDLPNGIPNPYYVDGLAWVVPWSTGLLLLPVLGILVFVFRALFGDPQTRQRLRFLGFTLLSAVVGFGLWGRGLLQRSGQHRAVGRRQRDDLHLLDRDPRSVRPRGLPLWRLRCPDRRSRRDRSPFPVAADRTLVCVRGRRPGDPLRPRADGGPSRGHHRRYGARPPAAALAGRGVVRRHVSATGTASSPCWSSSEPGWSRTTDWTKCSTSSPPPSGTGCGPRGRASASSTRRGSGPRRFRVAQAS